MACHNSRTTTGAVAGITMCLVTAQCHGGVPPSRYICHVEPFGKCGLQIKCTGACSKRRGDCWHIAVPPSNRMPGGPSSARSLASTQGATPAGHAQPRLHIIVPAHGHVYMARKR